ncbi:MAG: hypothetical protein A4E64_01817 [Syntrophorhabdus sp. PtaU1.Bin058]|nr:MAG: hypothetical protein A4E64_01817 [Syntrophorhabdus sp. PtaU1.Bin058]
MSKVNRRKIILLSYLCIITVQLFYSIGLKGIQNSTIYLLMLIVYSILTFLTFRGNKIAAWVVIVSILLSGIGAFLIGIFFITINQVTIKVTFILLGLYFMYGGIKLLSEIKAMSKT